MAEELQQLGGAAKDDQQILSLFSLAFPDSGGDLGVRVMAQKAAQTRPISPD
jgi:hypothetical protein